MKWRVTFLAVAGLETVEADSLFISNGCLMFSNREAETLPAVADTCGVEMSGSFCVRAAGHTGKHLSSLKPKWKAKPKLICIRAFAVGSWSDVRLVE